MHSGAFYSIVMSFGRFFNLHSHPSALTSQPNVRNPRKNREASPVLACHKVSSASPIRRGTLGTANHDGYLAYDSLKKTYL